MVGVGVMVAVGAVAVGVKEGRRVGVIEGMAVGSGARTTGYAATRNTSVRMKIAMITRLVSRKRVRWISLGVSGMSGGQSFPVD
jgi:hypothetical protein